MHVRILLVLVLFFLQSCLPSYSENFKTSINNGRCLIVNKRLWINHLLQVHPNYESYLPENKNKVLQNYYHQSDKQLKVINLIHQEHASSDKVCILRNEIAEIKLKDKMIRNFEAQRVL